MKKISRLAATVKFCLSIGTYSVLKYFGIAICIAGLHAASTLSVEAAPVAFESHYYEFVEVEDPFVGDNNSWWTARDAAKDSFFNGMRGHLATITSQAENDFLLSLAPDNATGFLGAWLGGKAPEGWLVGPEAGQGFTFTNWGGIEPNNNGFAYMNIGTLFAGIENGQWADESTGGFPSFPGDPVIGYFVEYQVPIPGAIYLFASGLLGLIGAAKRKA